MEAKCWLLLPLLCLGACSQSPNSGDDKRRPYTSQDGRYAQQHDAYPVDVPRLDHVTDAKVTFEPYSRQGNRDYQLRGQSYRVIKEPKGFSQEGYASWYGTKFHGYHTSNGEVYDMYAMTGAHKTLPLPSFVRVTNLDNNKQVVVRVNDRGPFHQGRVIDLSYAAAYKLDMLKQGTARVKIEVITAPQKETVLTPLKATQPLFVQVAASSDRQRAEAAGRKYAGLIGTGYQVVQDNGLYKVQLGPAKDELNAEAMIERLKHQGIHQPFKVYVEPQGNTGVNIP
ncbi:septal ring lytic transglycosylase RlpA family protein [Gallaecimonas xiamenensis]|uniref:Endolytic peptidoglycan transglycosylase RlpA n=1 Tax=Gallaecimonas xiamenensis 3-C-1 TaxID=745411 RepID=K2IYJ0_9GAMM|nr:septal ring lytic transglycosylase RlpA family protein [Gallaecimonas xiamenensis]EKE67627.1 rare lipoprotein A [Gallaecimonas xiamenensis 3-C-1]